MAQKQFIIDGGFSTNADSELVGNLEMTGHILPTVDSDGTTGYDLGSPTFKWRDLYLSQGSLYIDGQKVIESDSGTIVVTADPDQSLTTKVTGTGVLTFQSATTVSMASTLQMGTGKKITDQGGDAVTFGDKVDMDNNQIINVGAPTADGHATTKLYVDSLVGAISTDAITEGDTEIEIADLGTGTVGITVDGGQKLALSATAAAFTVPVTVNGNTLANEAYADQAEADAKTYADGIVATATTALQSYADTAETDAVSTANAYTDTAVANLLDSAPGALDTLNELAAALGDDSNFAATVTSNIATAKTEANTYTDGQIAALDFNNVSGGIAVTGGDLSVGAGGDFTLSSTSEAAFNGNTIVGEDPDAAGSPALCASSFRPTTGGSNLNLRSANGGAIDLDGGDVTYGGTGIVGDDPDNAGNPTVCASTFRPSSGVTDLNLRPGTGGKVTFGGSVLEGVSAPVAGTDAANKTYADARETAAVATANSYTDTAVSNLIDAAPGALDTLNELAAALGDDANFAATTTTAIATAKSEAITTASDDATTKANAAEAAAAADATTKADAAEAAAATDATTKANAAQAAAEATAAADATSKANAAQAAAISAAATDATTKADAAEAAAITACNGYADQAEADAISTAAADATSKANAAQAAAISAAASDATTKANNAESSANSYTDTAVSNLVNGASSAFDTLKEIQDAMATDAELSAAIAGLTIGNATITISAGNGLGGGAAFTTNQTSNETVTLSVNTGNGLTISSDAVQMSGSYTGTFTATGDICAYSDASLKTNVQTIEGAMGKVDAIRGVTFDRLEDGSTSTGVIAQELEAVLPEAVQTDENGVKMVAYGNVTGLLIEALKELKAEVESLKK